jgi:hypothetical protein
MILIYWPAYLESDYCLKEIRTMLEIEKKRRRILGSALQGCRLFIPIIIRGKFSELPGEVTEGCQYLDCTRQSTGVNFNIGDDPLLKGRLFEIAEYMKDLCDKMQSSEIELFGNCDKFVFKRPLTEPVRSVRVPQFPFPGRSS